MFLCVCTWSAPCARSAVIYICLCAAVGFGFAVIVLIVRKTNRSILHVKTLRMHLAAAVRAFLCRLTKSWRSICTRQLIHYAHSHWGGGILHAGALKPPSGQGQQTAAARMMNTCSHQQNTLVCSSQSLHALTWKFTRLKRTSQTNEHSNSTIILSRQQLASSYCAFRLSQPHFEIFLFCNGDKNSPHTQEA